MAMFKSAKERAEIQHVECANCRHNTRKTCPIIAVHVMAGPAARSPELHGLNNEHQMIIYDMLETLWPSDFFGPGKCNMFMEDET